jgi:ATP-dependent protease HslVU (ClpYQ) peptidase subunit
MTCIAGLVDDGKVFIGADSAGTVGYDLTLRADAKFFVNGECLIGFTSSYRMGQLLRYAFAPPSPHEGQDQERFMVVDFVDAVRACLKAGGFAAKDKEQESAGTFMVGFRGALYVVHGDYQVARPADNYTAIGAGDDFALGSLYSTDGQPAQERVKQALTAAAHHSAVVRAPFIVLSV